MFCPVQACDPFWIDYLKEYNATCTLPIDKVDTKLVKRRTPTYVVMIGTLYKRLYNGTLLRCLYPNEAKLVIDEIHEGVCSTHQGAYPIARRTIMQRVFLACDGQAMCRLWQELLDLPGVSDRLATNYTPINSVIPISRWGIDLFGILLTGSGNRRYLIVAIDYFTKWVEVEPMASIMSA